MDPVHAWCAFTVQSGESGVSSDEEEQHFIPRGSTDYREDDRWASKDGSNDQESREEAEVGISGWVGCLSLG